MSDSKQSSLLGEPSAANEESLRESLDELAANVDSLVDRLTMDLGDTPVEGAPAAPASTAASRPEYERTATVAADAGSGAQAEPGPTADESPEAEFDASVATPAQAEVEATESTTCAALEGDDELRDLAEDMVASLTDDGEEEPQVAAAETAVTPPAQATPQAPIQLPAADPVQTAPAAVETLDEPAALPDPAVRRPTDPVVPWAARGSSASTGGARRSFGRLALVGIFVGIAASAAWVLFSPGRKPPVATVADNFAGSPETVDSPAASRTAQIAPVAEGLTPRARPEFAVKPEPAPAAVVEDEPLPTPQPPQRSARAEPATKPDSTPAAASRGRSDSEPTRNEAAPRRQEPDPAPPQPRPALPPNAAVARTATTAEPEAATRAAAEQPLPQPVPADLSPEPQQQPTASLASAEPGTPQPQPATEAASPDPQQAAAIDPPPTVTSPVELIPLQPEPAVVEPVASAPVGSTGPASVVEPPRLLSRQEPVYSERARKRGDSGVVELRVLVSDRGRVVRVVVEQGIPGSELEARAIDAALRSSYTPAMEQGQPVSAWVTERFVFEP